jgi:predicted nucleotidyltransferase
MGRIENPKLGLAGALFSRVQLRVLSLLFGQPDRQFHASEIIRLAGSGSGAVQRELEKLTASGILSVKVAGNRKVYQANRQSPIFGELQGIIAKTAGLIEPLRQALKPFEKAIEAAFVYGSVAKGKDTAKSDIDLMIVGSGLSYSEIFAALQKAEKTLLRPVNPNLLDGGEWKRKRTEKGSFVSKIAGQPKLFVYGSEDGLSRIG